MGGIDSKGKVFFEKTKLRDKSTLKDIIRRNVIPGSHIVTDGWLRYKGLCVLGYQNSVVTYKEEFVNSAGLHTNRISKKLAAGLRINSGM